MKPFLCPSIPLFHTYTGSNLDSYRNLLQYSILITMSGIGSVFLGDNQRFRMLSSTPPSSPPSRSPVSATTGFPMISPTHSPKQSFSKATAPPPVIDPALSLELRLRWLEAILLGVRQDTKERKKLSELKHGETLIRLAKDVQRRLDAAVESNEGLKRFMDHCASNFFFQTLIYAMTVPQTISMPISLLLRLRYQVLLHPRHLRMRTCLPVN